MGELHSRGGGGKGRLQVGPDWSSVGMGKLEAGCLEMRHPIGGVREAYLAFSD